MATRRTPRRERKPQPLFLFVPSKRNPARVLEVEHLLLALRRKKVGARQAEEAMSIYEELLQEEDFTVD